MITLEEKLALFDKVVFEKVLGEFNKKLEELEKRNETLIKEYEEEVIQKSEKYKEEIIREAEDSEKKILTKAKNSAKSEVLNMRQALMNDLIEEIKVELLKFTETKAYLNYLEKIVKENLEDIQAFESLVVALMPARFEEAKSTVMKTIEASGGSFDSIEFEESDYDFLGGAYFLNGDGTMRIDGSLERLIEANEKFIGHLLYETLNKAGDLDE